MPLRSAQVVPFWPARNLAFQEIYRASLADPWPNQALEVALLACCWGGLGPLPYGITLL